MNIWYSLTLLGEPLIWGILSMVILVTYFSIRNRVGKEEKKTIKKCFFVFAVSIWLTLGIVFVLKIIINEERPCDVCYDDLTSCNQYCLPDSSFPSGHSALIFAVFTGVHICIRKKWFMPFFAIPFLVALSRNMLGVHYFIDIIFGTIIGALVPIAVLILYEKRFSGFVS